MIKRILILMSLLVAGVSCDKAAAVEHSPGTFKDEVVMVRSGCMGKDIPVTVITPGTYSPDEKEYPVIYILHGFSDDHRKWAKDGVVGSLVDQYDVIAVMPDGGFSSWYFDSPIMPEYRYETFVSHELPAYVDANYSTIKDRKGRAITGNSMGGHGALYNAIRHQDVFGSAGSLSGGVDIRPFPDRWHIAKRLGNQQEHPENWENNTVINMTGRLTPGSLNIVLDCGTSDFFYEVNCNLHEKLIQEKIPHDFYARPGGHNWDYWFNAIKYQFLFFCDRFRLSQNDTQ